MRGPGYKEAICELRLLSGQQPRRASARRTHRAFLTGSCPQHSFLGSEFGTGEGKWKVTDWVGVCAPVSLAC